MIHLTLGGLVYQSHLASNWWLLVQVKQYKKLLQQKSSQYGFVDAVVCETISNIIGY